MVISLIAKTSKVNNLCEQGWNFKPFNTMMNYQILNNKVCIFLSKNIIANNEIHEKVFEIIWGKKS